MEYECFSLSLDKDKAFWALQRVTGRSTPKALFDYCLAEGFQYRTSPTTLPALYRINPNRLVDHLENQSVLETSEMILKPTQNMNWDKGFSGHCSLPSEYFILFCNKFFLYSLMF